MDNKVGIRLKKLRKDYNFTQEQIAEFIGYDQSHIAKIENNERQLKVNALEKLCDLYNCSEEYILEGKGKYDKPVFEYRSNIKNIDINTRYKMNKIVRNIVFLNDIIDK